MKALVIEDLSARQAAELGRMIGEADLMAFAKVTARVENMTIEAADARLALTKRCVANGKSAVEGEAEIMVRRRETS